MDYISDNYLNKEGIDDKEFKVFANIYQQLGMVWEFLGLQCRHWDGYRETRDKKEVCKICGKVRDVNETHILLPVKGHKKNRQKESWVECSIDQHTINIRIGPSKEKGSKPDYGSFESHHSICF